MHMSRTCAFGKGSYIVHKKLCMCACVCVCVVYVPRREWDVTTTVIQQPMFVAF